MERYTVAVSTAPGEVKIRLLVPCFPHDTVSSLLKIIVARSLKNGHQVSVITHNATLRLGGPDGPVLDSDDELGEVIDSRTEQIHATFMEISEDEAQVLTEVVSLAVKTYETTLSNVQSPHRPRSRRAVKSRS